MVIEINEETNLAVVLSEYNGRKTEKVITMEDLISSLSSATRLGKYESVISPLFKEINGVKLIQSKSYGQKSTIYILQVKKRKAPTQIFSRFYGDVGYPHLLFAIDVVNDKLSKLKLVAVKDEIITEDTILYKYPYTNVSGDKGNVCLGNNDFEKGITKGDKLFDIPNQFFSMPNTLHSFNVANNSMRYQFEEMLAIFKDKDFDDDLLVENERLLSYKEWIGDL